MKRICFTAVRK